MIFLSSTYTHFVDKMHAITPFGQQIQFGLILVYLTCQLLLPQCKKNGQPMRVVGKLGPLLRLLKASQEMKLPWRQSSLACLRHPNVSFKCLELKNQFRVDFSVCKLKVWYVKVQSFNGAMSRCLLPSHRLNSKTNDSICIGNSMICSDIWHKYHE